jgi:hypothetical protein
MSVDNGSQQSESDRQLRQELYANARTELLERQFSNSEAYDKAILSLSSGFLALSLTFIKDIVPRAQLAHTWLLYLSWGTLAAAVIATVVSFRVSNGAIEAQLARAHRYYIERDEDAFKTTPIAKLVEGLNIFSGVAFIGGVVLTAIFVTLNFIGANPVSNKPQGGGPTRIEEGHVVPPMQKVTGDLVKRGQSVPELQKMPQPQAAAVNPARPAEASASSSSAASKITTAPTQKK